LRQHGSASDLAANTLDFTLATLIACPGFVAVLPTENRQRVGGVIDTPKPPYDLDQ
jgi:hypothetical protein